ncbi:Maf family protein [Psychromicrobium xiongbiense]|uniref:Maf family protein n=1 Tax=Psychromicrobium xiongbiense TaxID=3051184 RepID=UPI002554CA74|nr:Maf family protein [Psychromicrobium sp. YIM S02556]
MSPSLILASASPARAQLLRHAGLSFTVRVSSVDEDALAAAHPEADAAATALLLARAKAEAVAALPEAAGALVLGCDSVFEFDGAIHGKPHTPERARARLQAMSGRSGVLHTGHWLVDARDTVAPGEDRPGCGTVASATVHFDPLSEADIDAYIATGEPLEVAGSFTLDGRGAAFISSVEGDPNTVIGLSLSTLRSLLNQRGLAITELWA